MRTLATPREVLREIKSGKNRPWWVGKLFEDIERDLTLRGVIDIYMSAASIEALLEESVEKVQKPMSGAEMAAEFERIAKATGQVH